MARQDDFSERPGINSPDTGVAVTPSDTVDLPFVATCLWVGVAGDIAIRNAAGTSVVYKAVGASGANNTYFLARTSRVMATGTTATNLVACR